VLVSCDLHKIIGAYFVAQCIFKAAIAGTYALTCIGTMRDNCCVDGNVVV
jgi:hypothetical protein